MHAGCDQDRDRATPLIPEDGEIPDSEPISMTAAQQRVRSHLHSTNGMAPDPDHWPLYASVGVREQTAELASIALSDAGAGALPAVPNGDQDVSPLRISRPATRPREPSVSDHHPSSYLTHLLRKDHQLQTPPPSEAPSEAGEDHTFLLPRSGVATERDPLLPKYDDEARGRERGLETVNRDLESQGARRRGLFRRGAINEAKEKGIRAIKGLHARDVWRKGVVEPARYLPAVLLGLLLNVLDGLSYGEFAFFPRMYEDELLKYR
jgi:SulP family sulfate permease